jgi:hypothetical protein
LSSLRWLRPPGYGLSAEASLEGEIDDPTSTPSAPQGADSSAVPRRFQSLIIRDGGAQDAHVSLSAGEGQGPASDVAKAGRTEGQIRRTREGGSEWETIKILLEGDEDSNKTNTASNTRL